MKKIKYNLILLFSLVAIFTTSAQEKNDETTDFFKSGHSYWTAEASFGVIAAWDSESSAQTIGDKINVGLTLGISRTFESNWFVSTGASFSVGKENSLWSNPLNYFSANLEGGYQLKTETSFVPFLALGVSYINAPNTIVNSESTVTINPTAGFSWWFKNSSYGLLTKLGYKLGNKENMPSHQFLTIGLTKKF
jgi:hypothetical protein